MSDFISSVLHKIRSRRVLTVCKRTVSLIAVIASLITLCAFIQPVSALEQEDTQIRWLFPFWKQPFFMPIFALAGRKQAST